ncbi:MAG: dephospho-CoA kinase [Desulfarculaceae bacterium]|jgi:dephospho-CoA kinase
MLKAGLTGGIATGKSSVARMFEQLGAPLIDSDRLARKVVSQGSKAHAEIVAAFGQGVLKPDGELDRQGLRERVFNDAGARRRLEAIVHPRVSRLVGERLAQLAKKNQAKVVLVDVPLLYEAEVENKFDQVVLVYAPPAQQIERLMARDGIEKRQAQLALSAQMPIEQKRAKAQILIDNTGSLEETRRQVEAVWERLLNEAAGR